MRYAQVIAAALADLLKNYIEPNENPGSYIAPFLGSFLANQYNAATASLNATFGNPDLKEGKLKSAKSFFSTLKYEFPRLSLNGQNPHEFPENAREELSVFLKTQLEKKQKLKLESEKSSATNNQSSKLISAANAIKPAPAAIIQEKFLDPYLNKLLAELTNSNAQSPIVLSDEYLLKLLQALTREELANIRLLEEIHQKEQATYDSILKLCQTILEELEKKNLGEYLELYHQSAAGLKKRDAQAFMIENFVNQHLIARMRYWPYQLHTLRTPSFYKSGTQMIASSFDKKLNGDTVKALDLFSELMEKRLTLIKGEFCKNHQHCIILLKSTLFRILEIEKETGASLKAFSDPLRIVLETVKVIKPSSFAAASASAAAKATIPTVDKKTINDNPAEMIVLPSQITIIKCDSLISLIEMTCDTDKYRPIAFGFGPTVAKHYKLINSESKAWETSYPSAAAVVCARLRTLKLINESKLQNKPTKLVETSLFNIIEQEKMRIAQLRKTTAIHLGPYDWTLNCCSHIIQDLQSVDQYADVFLEPRNQNYQIHSFMQTLVRQYAALRVDFWSLDLVEKDVVFPDNFVKPNLSRMTMNQVSEIILECLQDTSKEQSETEETLLIIIESTLFNLKEIQQKQTSQLLNDIVIEFERRLDSIRHNIRYAEKEKSERLKRKPKTAKVPNADGSLLKNHNSVAASTAASATATTAASTNAAEPKQIIFSANHPSNTQPANTQPSHPMPIIVEEEGVPSPTAASTATAALQTMRL